MSDGLYSIVVLRVVPYYCGEGPQIDESLDWSWNQFYQIEEMRPYAQQIVANDTSVSGTRAILNWVNNHIDYVPDKEQFGRLDLFITPTAMMETKRGDCEDISFLTASLLQSIGLNTCYVVFGSVPGGYHAWLEFLCAQGYYIIEPQVGMVYDEGYRQMISYFPEYVITPNNGCFYNLDYGSY